MPGVHGRGEDLEQLDPVAAQHADGVPDAESGRPERGDELIDVVR